MENISFQVKINAAKEKVWNCLWDLIYYQTWTSVFAEISTVITDNWKEGSKIFFVDHSGNGMVSKILCNKENGTMTFQHLGMIKDGIEDTTSDEMKTWSGATESYHVVEHEGTTTLSASLDSNEQMKDFFSSTFPLALEKVKGLAEGTVKPIITVIATVNAPVSKVWENWTKPEHITKWNQANDDWHCPASNNDVKTGGKFSTTMAAIDGSFSFEFGGDYNEVKENEMIAATLGDGRMWKTYFNPNGNTTTVIERFEAEAMNSLELQQGGWQAILNNFKKYTETN